MTRDTAPLSVPMFLVGLLFLLLLSNGIALGQSSRATLRFDPAALAAGGVGDAARLERVRLPGLGEVGLELTRFDVMAPGGRFVVGHREIGDVPLEFDAGSVVLLRGAVAGLDHSHVFLSMYRGRLSGRIELGPGRERFVVTSRAGSGRELGPGEALVLPDLSAGGSLPGCGVRAIDRTGLPAGGREVEPRPGLLEVEVAVETDYELFEQFGDLDAELAYILQLYGAVSDIFLRDAGTGIVLTFVRVWDDPDDLFNEEDPLRIFRDYWNTEMEHVHRDVAQFLSGRVNFWYGGVAWLSAVCGDNGYSVSGYTLGYFADPDRPDVYNRDIIIPAHELGHNLGTGHSQDYGIDQCHIPETPAQRGGIMSYCGQTHTGGDANHDLRFHTITAAKVRELLTQAGCVAADCNQNGVADGDDIAGGTSEDANGNGVPDECEDCNGNGVLDDADIAQGTSADVDEDGRPDECEPDCNGNGLPDDYDIETLISEDAHGDGVPDECETDCDGDGVSDYTQINLDMSLDLDRDALLDGCEDCDGDGVTDLAQIGGDNNVWVADKERTVLREFLSRTGTVVGDGADAGLATPADVVVLADGRVLVTSAGDGRVAAFDLAGAWLGDLVAAGSGGLAAPGAMVISPSGRLLVASGGTDSVKMYDGQSGAYLGDLVAVNSGGLVGPFGVAVTPSGALLVTSADARVLEFDVRTGAFIRELVTTDDNGGLSDPRGLLVLPSGNVLAASRGTSEVLEFDGASGAFVRKFNRGGTADRMTLDQPWCMRLGPDGDVYVSRAHDHESPFPDRDALHLTNARIFQFDAQSGKMVRAYVQSLDSGIEHPTGFDFVRSGGDCNLNLVPDSCDISMGVSEDEDGDGVPDECRGLCAADHDGNGVVDTRDFLLFLTHWSAGDLAADFNDDLVIDIRDFILFLGEWSAGC